MALSAGSFERLATDLVATYAADNNPSARVLISTLFGDSIRPHAESIWLGSIATLLGPLGISDRLVRTSLRRLVGERILVNTQTGRRSFYSIHPEAESTFRRAGTRIYRRAAAEWSGRWTIVTLDATAATPKERARLRRELGWLGMGPIGPNVLGSPVLTPQEVADTIERFGFGGDALITESTVFAPNGTLTDEALAGRVAPLRQLEESYLGVLGRYSPLAEAAGGSDPQQAFLVRLLCISDYRRVVLADPGLPRELLPADWAGDAAYDLVGGLYHRLTAASDAYLVESCETPQGLLTLHSDAHRERFVEQLP